MPQLGETEVRLQGVDCTRVLVIGLDGANIDLIRQWSQEGKLPAFRKLLDGGCHGPLESVIPTITIPAWNCMTSGKNSGKTGVFSFIQKAYGTYDFRVYQMLNRKEESVWDILSDAGKEVFVFNAPNVLYAYPINGWLVSGVICLSDDKLTWPPDLRKELEGLGYKRDIGDIQTLWSMNDAELQAIHRGITDSQCQVLLHFLEKKWDFGFFVLTELDRIQHAFWNQKDVLLASYQNIDRNLGLVLDKIGDDTTVFMFSDHGFGPNERTFLVNEWLANRGLLKTRQILTVKAAKTLLRIQKWPAVVSVLRTLWRQFSFMRPLYLKLARDTSRTPIQWDQTKAYSYATFGTIYLNVAGREPLGIVKPEDYERVRTEIIEGLKEVPAKAYRCEELYHGDFMASAPDIVVEIDDYVHSVSGVVGYGKIFRERFGGHHDRHNGTFIAWGPGIRKGATVQAKMFDVVPTLLHFFDLPLGRDLDGRVLREIFDGNVAARETRFMESAESERVRKRVRDLKARGII
ncbi:MAG TPA: alkaline phosphatase family protein [Methanomicrobiales archaeon]|nr:alkaline phosphatase family protein [Methanomicrobiales archaeon]